MSSREVLLSSDWGSPAARGTTVGGLSSVDTIVVGAGAAGGTTVGGLSSVDTIVVGAGAAGCVVARRLADDGHRVALFEAGPGRPQPEALTTVDALAALEVDQRLWPGARIVGRERRSGGPYLLGRGLGGGSAVNSLVLMSGNRSDYDSWEAHHGLTGWRWSSLEPWFESIRRSLNATTAELGPLALAFGTAALEYGHARCVPSIEPDGIGFGPASLACAGTERVSAADAFLGTERAAGADAFLGTERAAGADAFLGRDEVGEGDLGDGLRRLTVHPDQLVRRIRFDGDRAAGAELDDGRFVGAERVILCAGALGSPALLARSGVVSGPFRLGDHPSFVLSVRLRPDHRVGPDRPTAPISGLLRWRADEPGRQSGVGDVAALVMDHVGRQRSQRAYGAIVVSLLGARSVGGFRPDDTGFAITPAGLTDLEDQHRMLAAVRHVKELIQGAGMDAVVDGVYLDDAGTPVDAMAGWSDDELLDWLRLHPGPVHHPASSLPMEAGGGEGGIDVGGAVVGRTGLYVADASVLPQLPTANPQLPVMAVAARIAAGIPGP